jgi:hypothetical protein
MTRVANSQARLFVDVLLPFTGSNTYGRTLANGAYAVFSYGEHWPLYLRFSRLNRWYGNSSRFSRTTSKHANQLRPTMAATSGLFLLPLPQLKLLVELCDDADLQTALRAADLAVVSAAAADNIDSRAAHPPAVATEPVPNRRRLLPLVG